MNNSFEFIEEKQHQQTSLLNKNNTQKKCQYYLSIHNKLKVEFRNKEYKNIYEKLIKLEEPQELKHLYYEDILLSINALLKEAIIHKQIITNPKYIYQIIAHGKNIAKKIYKLYIIPASVTGHKKAVVLDMKKYISRFYTVVIGFSINISFIYQTQGKIKQAAHLFQTTYIMVSSILHSSTHNYKLLRKTSHFLLVYSCFLIQNGFISKAISILKQNILNQVNLLLIINWIPKKDKKIIKNRKVQCLNRLFSILLNIFNCQKANEKYYNCLVYLKQCERISRIKAKLTSKQIKIKWPEIMSKFQIFYQYFSQLRKIVQQYFSQQQLSELDIKASNNRQLASQRSDQKGRSMKTTFTQLNTKRSNIHVSSKDKKGKGILIKRSVSLQDHLSDNDHQNQLYKKIGKQVLFYGFDKQNNKQNRCKIRQSSELKSSNFKKIKLQSNISKPQNKKAQVIKANVKFIQNSKLQKKTIKQSNFIFKHKKQPYDYEKQSEKIQNLCMQEKLHQQKTKQQIILLRYKANYLNYKQIAKQNKSIHAQIKVLNDKQRQFRKSSKKQDKVIEEEQKQQGVNLLRKIILKHALQLDIKKSQTLNLLRKKRNSYKAPTQVQIYNPPSQSIQFLLEGLQKQKIKYKIVQQKRQSQSQQDQFDEKKGKLFLASDNKKRKLFLSYVASPTAVNQRIQNVLNFKTMTRLQKN